MHVTRRDNRIYIHKVSVQERPIMIALGASYNANSMQYVLPFTQEYINRLQNAGCTFPTYMQYGVTQAQFMQLRLNKIVLPEFITESLFPYQVQGIKMLFAGFSLLADEMGLGKTITLLRFMQGSVHRRAIVACPAFLKEKWAYEVKKWTNFKPFVIYGRKPVKLPKIGVYIINYDILEFHLENLKTHSIELFAADEAHLCKNDATKRTRALRTLAEHSTRYIPMTGTPILNNAQDLYPHLNILAKEDFYSKKIFLENYCVQIEDRVVGTKNHAELNKILLDSIMIRRTYDEVKKDFGGTYDVVIDSQIVPIKLTSYRLYEEAVDDLAGYVYRTTGKVYGASIDLHRDRILKELIYEEKKKTIFEWLDNFLLYGEKITLFFTRTKHLLEFAERYNAVTIYGQTDMKQRLSIVNDFNTNSSQVLCCNIRAAGVGLDIVGCHNTGFIDFDYVWENMKQAIKRFDRIGQKFPVVSVYYFVGLQTIEESDTLSKLDKKHETARRIVDGRTLKNGERLQAL